MKAATAGLRKPAGRRRRINYIAVLAISLLCLLLILASHRFTNSAASDLLYTPIQLSGPGGGFQDADDAGAGVQHRKNGHRLLRPADPSATAAAAAAADATGDHLALQALASASASGPDSTRQPPSAAAATLSPAAILLAQRDRIATDMLNFEFTGAGQSLERLAPATGGQPLRSLIVTTWRSGSTFLGDILNALPANFYHYEPLLQYDIRQIRGGDRAAPRAMQQLRQLLACNYSGAAMAEYLQFGATHNYLHNHNGRLWRWCRQRPALCSDARWMSEFCALFPLQSMKVVRVRWALVEELLAAAELGDRVRAVLLVRDPRGVLQSRKHREWCPGRADCDRAERLCADMVADWRAMGELARRWPGRVRWVRYEDLSVEPFARTQELLAFWGLPFDAGVEEFLDSHTRADVGGVSSTFRDSKAAPFHWMAEMPWREVQEVQSACGEAMRLWGYRRAESRAVLRQRGFSSLGNVTGWT